ncbi:MAG: hypothetical protein Q9169_005461 [Polycauliona sp. 2 TL-2023]
MARRTDAQVFCKPWSLLAWCLLLPFVSSACYYDSGSIAPEYTPCNASAVGTTHCCQNGHTCLDTGLCLVSWDTSVNTGSCTDESWDSKGCFKKCPGSRGALNTLYRCDDNQWCCSLGGNTTGCCQDPNVETFEVNGNGDPSRVMGGSAFVRGYTIAPIAALETGEPKNELSPASNQTGEVCSTSGDDTMKVGLGAGLGIGLPLTAALATLLFFLLREKRINRELRRNTGVPNMTGNYASNDNARNQNATGHKSSHELDSGFGAAELPNDNKVQLPA